jgi:hypothetical protein
VPPVGSEGNLPTPLPEVGQLQGEAASAEGLRRGEPGASADKPAAFPPWVLGVLWLLGGLLGVVTVTGLAWWLVGTYPVAWKVVAWLGGGLTVLLALWGTQSATSAKTLGICAFVVWAYMGWLVIGLTRLPTLVYVDNFSTHDVSLELDGEPWMVVNRGTKREVWMQRETYQLKVRSARTGEVLDRRTITVDESGPYILNVLGAGTYEKGFVEYVEDLKDVGWWKLERKPERIRDVWIRADVNYLFEEPPSRISATKGTKSATKYYLRRLHK